MKIAEGFCRLNYLKLTVSHRLYRVFMLFLWRGYLVVLSFGIMISFGVVILIIMVIEFMLESIMMLME